MPPRKKIAKKERGGGNDVTAARKKKFSILQSLQNNLRMADGGWASEHLGEHVTFSVLEVYLQLTQLCPREYCFGNTYKRFLHQFEAATQQEKEEKVLDSAGKRLNNNSVNNNTFVPNKQQPNLNFSRGVAAWGELHSLFTKVGGVKSLILFQQSAGKNKMGEEEGAGQQKSDAKTNALPDNEEDEEEIYIQRFIQITKCLQDVAELWVSLSYFAPYFPPPPPSSAHGNDNLPWVTQLHVPMYQLKVKGIIHNPGMIQRSGLVAGVLNGGSSSSAGATTTTDDSHYLYDFNEHQFHQFLNETCRGLTETFRDLLLIQQEFPKENLQQIIAQSATGFSSLPILKDWQTTIDQSFVPLDWISLFLQILGSVFHWRYFWQTLANRKGKDTGRCLSTTPPFSQNKKKQQEQGNPTSAPSLQPHEEQLASPYLPRKWAEDPSAYCPHDIRLIPNSYPTQYNIYNDNLSSVWAILEVLLRQLLTRCIDCIEEKSRGGASSCDYELLHLTIWVVNNGVGTFPTTAGSWCLCENSISSIDQYANFTHQSPSSSSVPLRFQDPVNCFPPTISRLLYWITKVSNPDDTEEGPQALLLSEKEIDTRHGSGFYCCHSLVFHLISNMVRARPAAELSLWALKSLQGNVQAIARGISPQHDAHFSSLKHALWALSHATTGGSGPIKDGDLRLILNEAPELIDSIISLTKQYELLTVVERGEEEQNGSSATKTGPEEESDEVDKDLKKATAPSLHRENERTKQASTSIANARGVHPLIRGRKETERPHDYVQVHRHSLPYGVIGDVLSFLPSFDLSRLCFLCKDWWYDIIADDVYLYQCIRRPITLDVSLQIPAMRFCSNICSAGDAETQRMVERGIVPFFQKMIFSPLLDVREEACFALSNIAAGTEEQLLQMLKQPRVLRDICKLAWDVVFPQTSKEACWILANTVDAVAHFLHEKDRREKQQFPSQKEKTKTTAGGEGGKEEEGLIIGTETWYRELGQNLVIEEGFLTVVLRCVTMPTIIPKAKDPLEGLLDIAIGQIMETNNNSDFLAQCFSATSSPETKNEQSSTFLEILFDEENGKFSPSSIGSPPAPSTVNPSVIQKFYVPVEWPNPTHPNWAAMPYGSFPNPLRKNIPGGSKKITTTKEDFLNARLCYFLPILIKYANVIFHPWVENFLAMCNIRYKSNGTGMDPVALVDRFNVYVNGEDKAGGVCKADEADFEM